MRGSRWTTRGLTASERGATFSSGTYWTQYNNSGGGTWAIQSGFNTQSPGQAWPFFGWNNNGAAGLGAYAYVYSGALIFFDSVIPGSSAHTVHIRVQDITSNTIAATALGPATVIHSAGAGTVGNCYHVIIDSSAGVGSLVLRRMNGGASTVLNTTTRTIVRNDVVSLSYQYNAASSRAELGVYHNGEVVALVNDSSGSRYDLSAVSGKPGLFGNNSPSIPGTNSVGAWTSEWWVTNGFGSFAELPPAYPSLVGGLSIVIQKARRFTDSPEQTKVIYWNELLGVNWGYARIGGCNSASAKIRVGQAHEATASAPQLESDLVEPNASDWEANEWLGGHMLVNLRFDGRDLNSSNPQTMWRGTISGLSFDPKDRTVQIEADGLSRLLDKTVVVKSFKDISIRDAVVSVIQSVAKGPIPTTPTEPVMDFPIKFNPAKIIGLSSIMDFRITKDFKWESARSAIEDLIGFLPDGIVWGVDQYGDFYLQVQNPPYGVDLNMSVPAVTYDAASALDWNREFRLDNITNDFIAIGAEPDDESEPRISSGALCEKSSAIFGRRQEVESLEDTDDQGILAKYAQTVCKQRAGPEFSCSLTVRENLQGLKTFWQSLSTITPYVAVIDRTSRENLSPAGERIATDHALRLMGDVTGGMAELRGSTGAQVRFPSLAVERMSRSWLLHVVLKFTHGHNGGVGDYAFILGRPSAAGPRRGWGALYWFQTTGELFWIQDEAGAATLYNLGIAPIDTSVGSPTPLHLTIARLPNGAMRAYEGTTPRLSGAPNANALATGNTDDWAFWTTTGSTSTTVPWDGAMEQFWLIDTLAPGWFGDPIDGQPLAVPGFVSRTNGKNLPRNEGTGALMHIKFNERVLDAVAEGRFGLWRGSPGGGGAYDATLVDEGAAFSDTAATSSDTARGPRVGQQRWGGPLVLAAETVEYTVDPSVGEVDIAYQLGARPAGLARSVEGVKEELRKQTDALRRLKRDI